MIKNRDIVYFANDWDSDHKVSSHHIAKELKRHNRILYVETGGLRKPRTSKRDLKRILTRLILWSRGFRRSGNGFYIFSLIILPFHGRFFSKLNAFTNTARIKHFLRKHKFEKPILWFSVPHVVFFADHIKNELIVYYCTDDVSRMPDVDKDAVQALEDVLLDKADIVFATSEHLAGKIKASPMHPDVFYSPHAVDHDHFAGVQDGSLRIADDIIGLGHPVIGFVGLVEKWIDLDLIRYIAESRKNWSVVLVGRVAVPTDKLTHLKNVIFLGTRKYAELPSYIKGFDVCISPFKVNELTKSVNPIKLKEYLSSGKPVVVTRIPEMEKFAGLVEVADTYDEFVQRIDKVLRDGDKGVKVRMDSVQGDSWRMRVEDISLKIEDAIKEKTREAQRSSKCR